MHKENNNGYSLIELVITMAIFSIIMLAIIMMMRTSVASYRNGLFETTMQEEAQIVANQIHDLLIDASYYNGTLNDNPGSKSYSFKGPDGDFEIYQDGNNLYITKGSETQLLSNQISSTGFSIDGLAKRASDDTSTVYDNAATINLGIEYQGREFSTKKDVYFRNNIEDIAFDVNGKEVLTPFDVAGGTTISGGGGGSTKEVVPVLRYHTFDVSAEYDIVYDAKLSTTFNGILTLESDPNGNNMITHPITGHGDPCHYTVRVTDESAAGFGNRFPINASDQDNYYIEGYDSKGVYKKILLRVDAVAIKNGAGIYQLKNNGDKWGNDGNGYASPIQVEGIHINDALINNVSIKYSAVLKNGTTEKGSCNNVDVKKITGVAYAKGIANSTTDCGDLKLAISGDPLTSGMEITTAKDNSTNHISYIDDTSKQNTLKIKFDIAGKPYTITYFLLYNGGSLESIN